MINLKKYNYTNGYWYRYGWYAYEKWVWHIWIYDSSINIHNLTRGLSSWPYKNINSWPTAHTYYKDIPIKIFKSKSLEANIIKPPGYIIDASNEGITVATNNGILLIEILQFPGGKPLEVKEFLKGNKIEKGIVLS